MPYSRRRLAAPIKSDKHEVTWSFLSVNASTRQDVPLAVAVASADKNASTECEIGSHVYGIYVEINFSVEDTTNAKIIHWWVKGMLPSQVDENPSSYYSVQRSQVLKRGMEMVPADKALVVKRIIFVKIPKKFRRQVAGSSIEFQFIASSSQIINVCGFAVYKEFY